MALHGAFMLRSRDDILFRKGRKPGERAYDSRKSIHAIVGAYP